MQRKKSSIQLVERTRVDDRGQALPLLLYRVIFQEFRVRYRYKGSMRLKTISCARFGREGAKRLTAAFVERWRLSGRFVAAKTHRSRLALVDLPQDTQLLPSYDKKRAPSPLTSSSLLFQLSQSPSIFSLSSTFLGQSPPFPPLNPAAAAASASCAPPPRPGLFLGGSRVAPFHAWPCKPGSALWGGDDICESSNGGVGTSGAQPLVSNGGSGAFFDICTLTQGGFRAGGVEQATAAALLEAKRNGRLRRISPDPSVCTLQCGRKGYMGSRVGRTACAERMSVSRSRDTVVVSLG